MPDITAEQITAALSIPIAKVPQRKTCAFTIPHGGVDGFARNTQLAQFITRMRLAALTAAHSASWPHPECVTRAEVSIVAHGSHCGPQTLAHLEEFFSRHIYAGRKAVIPFTPVVVKSAAHWLEVTIRAIEVVEPETGADRAARLAREASPPAMLPDGTYEGDLQPWERPAFIDGQGVPEVDPLAARLDRMESEVQIPQPEDDIDPPSVKNADDPDAAAKRWHHIMAHEAHGKGGSSSKAAPAKPNRRARNGQYVKLTQEDGQTRPMLLAGRVSEVSKAAFDEQEQSAGEIMETIGQLLAQGVPIEVFERMLQLAAAWCVARDARGVVN